MNARLLVYVAWALTALAVIVGGSSDAAAGAALIAAAPVLWAAAANDVGAALAPDGPTRALNRIVAGFGVAWLAIGVVLLAA